MESVELLADRVVFLVGHRTWQPATDLDSLQDGDSLEHLTGRVRGLAPVAVAFESSCLEEGEATGEGKRERTSQEAFPEEDWNEQYQVTKSVNLGLTHIGELLKLSALVVGDDAVQQHPLRAVQLLGRHGQPDVVLQQVGA